MSLHVKRTAALIVALLVLPLLGPGDGRAEVFIPQSFTLANGMRVVVIPNHRAPVVTHMVWYKVGSADDPHGRSGIAHFFEHLMFKATKTLKSGEFSRIVARNGGRDNAFTSNDYTGYFQSVAVDRLPIVMSMEADRMRNLVLDPAEIEPERQVVLEERRSRTDNSPRARLYEQMNAALYLNHPYRNPIIGWEHEIRAIGLADLKAFYDRWYAPNNAVLVVAGDITAEKLRPLAEKYYGRLEPGPATPRQRTQEPPPGAARRITLSDKRVRQPGWRRAYLAPSHGFGDKTLIYPLEVLAEIFGSGPTSRLYRSLVIDQKLAVSARARYDADGLGPSSFSVGASPLPGISMEKLEAGIEAQIARLMDQGVSEDETARARQRLIDGAVFARDSLRAGARVLGAALSAGQSIADVENWPDRIAAVSAAQVSAAARAVFRTRASVTGYLLPSAKKPGRRR